MLLRALRPSKYRRFHWPMILTYLEHSNSYKKDANHNRGYLTTTMDFGNLFTDCESELCEVISNEVEHRTLQSYSCRLTEQYDFSSSQAPRPLLNSTVQRHQLHRKPTEDSRVQAKWRQHRQQDFLTLANRATAKVLLRAR